MDHKRLRERLAKVWQEEDWEEGMDIDMEEETDNLDSEQEHTSVEDPNSSEFKEDSSESTYSLEFSSPSAPSTIALSKTPTRQHFPTHSIHIPCCEPS